MASTTAVTVETIMNPFPGLRPFQEREEHLFFGRESQVHTMVDKLLATRFLAVVGSSGSGKSSLVNCGLRPALHRGLMAAAGTSWRMAQFRPGGSPIRSLALALAKDGVLFSEFDSGVLQLEDMLEAPLRMSELGILRVYRDAHLPAGTNLLIVVDQFEELFRYRTVESQDPSEVQRRSQEATAFVNLLLAPRTQSSSPIYIVLTMRSDFLGECADFAGLPEAVNEGEYLIPRLTREERRAAIEGPIGVAEARISPVLLTRLVNDVGDNPDQLSILQHALNRTWARWENDGLRRGPIDLEHYEAIGTMAKALNIHAEKAYSELTSERERKLCEKIFKALTDKETDPRGVRRPTKFRTLCELLEAKPEEVKAVLGVFRKPSRSFLMPPAGEELKPDTVIDISHESFMRIWKLLVDWTEEEVQSARQYRRLAQCAVLHSAGEAALWDDPDLQSALKWKNRECPTKLWADFYGGEFDLAMKFLADSQVQRDGRIRENEQRHRRELEHANALAAERQQKFEQQKRASFWLRLGLAAMFLVGIVMLLALFEVTAAKKEAIRERNKAIEARHEQEVAKNVATEREHQAEESERALRMEALRLRDLSLESHNQLRFLADELLKYSSPEQSAYWSLLKGDALLSSGRYGEAESALTDAVNTVGDNFSARTARGYLYVLLKKPGRALPDFGYIRDHLDQASPLNNLNLAVTYAAMGDHKAARALVRDAIRDLPHKAFESAAETAIPREITLATGRTTLTADADIFAAALRYMAANLESYEGHTFEFAKTLKEADENASGLTRATSKDAYFIAMTWAWLHLRIRCPEDGKSCKDYGGFVAQAELWKRAGFADWAACYYDRFLERNNRWPEAQYAEFAQYAQEQRSAIRLSSGTTCKDLIAPPADVPELEVIAREAMVKGNYSEAKDALDKALAKSGPPMEGVRLLLQQANVLYLDGRMQRQNARRYRRIVEENQSKIDSLNKEREQEGKKTPGKNDLAKTDYAAQISAAEKDSRLAEQQQERYANAANSSFRALKNVCDQILQKNPRSAKAYYWRAMAQDWLDASREDQILRDLNHALALDPAYEDALQLLDELVPSDADAKSSYLKQYGSLLDLYHKSLPFNADAMSRKARIAQHRKQNLEALQAVEAAIAMEPDDLALYDLRANAEGTLGFSETQVDRDLADGYRHAGDVETRRGNLDQASEAYTRAWRIMRRLAKEGDAGDIRCDANLLICTSTTTTEQHSELIVASIVKTGQRSDTLMQATLDKGGKDGIVVGSEGTVYSHESSNGHERHIRKIGKAKVVSVEPETALVHIEMDSPEGDGLVREKDFVQLRAITPAISSRSPLWELVKYDAAFSGFNEEKLFDYRTLYRDETPEVATGLLERMLDGIHEAGDVLRQKLDDEVMEGKPVSVGRFANQTLSESLRKATLADVNLFVDYLVNHPSVVVGLKMPVWRLYAAWIAIGAPSS